MRSFEHFIRGHPRRLTMIQAAIVLDSEADSHATVAPVDGGRRRPVAALVHSDERNGRGAGARKGNSDDLPDTILATSLLFVLRFMGGLILAYVESIFSSVVA